MLILLLLSIPLLSTEGKVVSLKSAESKFLPDDDVIQQPHNNTHKLDRWLKPEETRKIAAEEDDGHKVEREKERERERKRERKKERERKKKKENEAMVIFEQNLRV